MSGHVTLLGHNIAAQPSMRLDHFDLLISKPVVELHVTSVTVLILGF